MNETILTLVRSLIFLWNGFNFFLLYHLYYFGYQRIRPSRIIGSLAYLYLALGTMYTLSSFLPVINVVNRPLYLSLLPWTTILHLPVALFAQWFRLESLSDQSIHVKKTEIPVKVIEQEGGEANHEISR